MLLNDFDFELPDDLIALRPVSPRDHARLLVVRPDEPCEGRPQLDNDHIYNLIQWLKSGDCLVFNDTKVLPARLQGRRVGRGETSPRIEVTLHKQMREHSSQPDRSQPDRPQFEQENCWACFAKPGRKLAIGDIIDFSPHDNSACMAHQLEGKVLEKRDGGEIILSFNLAGTFLLEAIEALGHMPLPPYIASKRAPDAKDEQDYQTLFAQKTGAVAAPTAGLHFTPDLLARLKAKGVETRVVTLHVGAGTFLPVKVDNISEHKMHSEWGEIDADTAAFLNQTRKAGGRVVAVGTTSLRILETCARESGVISPFRGDTDIFITPGYQFRAIDLMLTNFHLPKSTLFMLVSAFSGLNTMQQAYAHAISEKYRFYSYGDGCLLFPQKL